MTGMSRRFAAASGAVYIAGIIVGEQLTSAHSAVVERGGYGLIVVGFTAFVVFVTFLHPILREADGPAGWLAPLALSAGVLHSAVRFAAQPPRMVVAYRGDALSPELSRTLEDLNGMAFVATGLMLGVYCATAGWICLRHGVLPRWLAWCGTGAGVLAVAAGVVGMVDPDAYLPLPFLAGLIWTAIVSVVLTVRPVRGALDRTSPAVGTAAAS